MMVFLNIVISFFFPSFFKGKCPEDGWDESTADSFYMNLQLWTATISWAIVVWEKGKEEWHLH